jgi:hypothetical protein
VRGVVNHPRNKLWDYAIGLGCMVFAVLLGGCVAVFGTFLLAWSMTEQENYRNVPEDLWWVVRAAMLAAQTLPIAAAVVLASLVAPAGTRKIVAIVGILLGTVAASLGLMNLLGIRLNSL